MIYSFHPDAELELNASVDYYEGPFIMFEDALHVAPQFISNLYDKMPK